MDFSIAKLVYHGESERMEIIIHNVNQFINEIEIYLDCHKKDDSYYPLVYSMVNHLHNSHIGLNHRFHGVSFYNDFNDIDIVKCACGTELGDFNRENANNYIHIGHCYDIFDFVSRFNTAYDFIVNKSKNHNIKSEREIDISKPTNAIESLSLK